MPSKRLQERNERLCECSCRTPGQSVLTGLLDCGASIVAARSTYSARRRRIDTTPGALHEIFLVHGVGTVNACWCWSCRSRRQSRGARGRSYNNRSAEIAKGCAQPGVAAPDSGASSRKAMYWPLSSKVQLVEHLNSTRIEHASMFGNPHSGRTLFVRTFVLIIPRSMACLRTAEP